MYYRFLLTMAEKEAMENYIIERYMEHTDDQSLTLEEKVKLAFKLYEEHLKRKYCCDAAVYAPFVKIDKVNTSYRGERVIGNRIKAHITPCLILTNKQINKLKLMGVDLNCLEKLTDEAHEFFKNKGINGIEFVEPTTVLAKDQDLHKHQKVTYG